MSGGAVSLSHVVKRYDGDRSGRAAVSDVSLDIAAGEVLTLLGASGSGKTTTLRIIAGLERATAGEVRIGGQLVSSPTVHLPIHKRQIGMVFQSYAVWPHMTVVENVAYPLKIDGVAKRQRLLQAQEVLGEVGLAELADRLPGSLSGGQQQRVALARAIIGDPRVILYDEPLSNLDARLRDRLREQIRALHDRLGITAIYVTHDQREAMAISDRIAMMEDGSIEQVGTPQELYLSPARRCVAEFVGEANMLPVSRFDPSSGSAWISESLSVRLSPTVSRSAASDSADAAEQRFLMIRPHRLRLAPKESRPDQQANAFAATVSSVRFFGDHVRARLTLADGVSLLAELTPPAVPEDMIAETDRVTVLLDPQHLLVVS